MLAEDIEMLGLDGRHLAGWLELVLPPGVSRRARVALVFVDRGAVVKAALAGPGAGALELHAVPFTGTSPRQMADLRTTLGTDALAVLELDALPRLFRDIESSLRIGDDYAAQAIAMWRALKRILGKGIWIEPRLLDVLPVVSADALQRTFDLLVPDGTSLVAYAFADDRESIAASAIATKHGGDLDLFATHLAIDGAVPERALARSWRTQYRRALAEISDRFASPSIGVFFERRAFYRIAAGPTDQLARELASGGVIIDPAPAWLSGLLGGAAAVAMAAGAARALARFVPPAARRAAAGIAEAASKRLEESGAHPFALLGFDPIDLWLRVRHVYAVGSGA